MNELLFMLAIAAVWGVMVGCWLARHHKIPIDPQAEERIEQACLSRLKAMEVWQPQQGPAGFDPR